MCEQQENTDKVVVMPVIMGEFEVIKAQDKEADDNG
jgi:hypothetical protein